VVRQRFHREARAAAQLHHTNIVPVFEVGEDDNTCWYAMQLILGQGLDQIIEELRQHHQPVNEARPSLEPARPSLSRVTQSLVSGQFACPDLDASTPPPVPPQAAFDSSESTVVASRSELPVEDSGGSRYYRGVARIGRQVAEGLAHAHARGIIHRDIKPSNVLLDTAGVAWITDFGLAKSHDNSLTTTGDIVGTLRYMAPERFKGEGDERTDVYGLGLTLYELLVFRPAFVERDRLQLIDRIKSQEPARPRIADPRIPRDLETIVLKAIHKEPKQRYQTAEALAEDLRRLLANEPIKAKRTSHLTRLRLWSRRNPALAALLLLLALVAVASTATAFYLNTTLRESEGNRQRAEKELWRSYLTQARAERMSRQSGQRFASLQAIQAALELPVPPGHSRDELRTEAIAALCLPDLELYREGNSTPVGASGFTIDAAFQRYAWADREGNVRICRLSDDKELLQLPGAGPVDNYGGLQFSPNGRFLHQQCKTPKGIRSRLWDLDADPKPKAVVDDDHNGLAFRHDSCEVAIFYRNRTVRFLETVSRRELRRFTLDITPLDSALQWNPKLPQLCVYNRTSIRLLNVDTGAAVEVGPKIPGGYSWTAWHPEGRLLAVSGQTDCKIYLWDVPTGRLVMPPLEDHKHSGVVMRFNHAGDRLLSTDWNYSWHLWEARSGRLLLTLPTDGIELSFSPDDLFVGTVSGGVIRRYRFRRGEELRTLIHRSSRTLIGYNGDTTTCLDLEGRLCAIGTEDGIALVDVARGEEAALLPLHRDNLPLRFDAEGALWTGGPAGLLRWPRADDPKAGRGRYGPPQRILQQLTHANHGGSPDMRVVAIPRFSAGAMVFHRDSKRMMPLREQQDVRTCAVSPDGRWVATGSHYLSEGVGAKVWDASDGRHIKDLTVGELCHVCFSPGGKWLLTTGGGPRLWVVGTWQQGPTLNGTPSNSWGAFSPDDKLLALERSEKMSRRP
jgi:eukaryotic-like serine/threonine-protein kinase